MKNVIKNPEVINNPDKGPLGSAIPQGTIFTSTGPSYQGGLVNTRVSVFFKGQNGYVYDLQDPTKSYWNNGDDLNWSQYNPVSINIEVMAK